MTRALPSLVFVLLLALSCTQAGPRRDGDRQQVPISADLILRDGNVITLEDAPARARAVAVKGGYILAVGSNEEIDRHRAEGTRVLELDGMTVVPGFIEGHGHFTGLGDALQILDLTDVRHWGEVVDRVAAAVAEAEPGEWIRGRGWHQEKWRRRPPGHVEGFPTHDSVSAVSPDNPVALTHASGHASFFNRKAMDLAGIDADTADPEGGEILRDDEGHAIGVFRETAQSLVRRVYTTSRLRLPAPARRAALADDVRRADRECLRKGVTSFQDAGSSFRTIDVLRDMVVRDAIGTRLYVMVRERNQRLAEKLPAYRMVGFAGHRLTVRAIKRTLDGALGARGAWLLEPYSDAPDSTGLRTTTLESLAETARLAVEHGYQLCVHAIGDRANREVLDLYEDVFASQPGLDDPRWRVEHAQHLHPDDIPRFGELGVIASMQGIHCTSDGPWVIPRLGEERAAEGAYVWRDLLDSGAVVTNGTDAPVEDVDPIASYHASVTRRLADGSTFFPGQCMARMEALRSYTIDAAYAAFEEDLKGSIHPGKLADLVVLSQDITTVPADRIPDTRVECTIVGGQVRFRREGDG